MRDYVRQLRPGEIENEPLVPMLRRYLDSFGERTVLSARLRIRSREVDLPPSSRLVMLKILQEVFTKAAKHSDATEVQVSLPRTGNRGVHCIVEDNGRGFDENQVLRDAASRRGFAELEQSVQSPNPSRASAR